MEDDVLLPWEEYGMQRANQHKAAVHESSEVLQQNARNCLAFTSLCTNNHTATTHKPETGLPVASRKGQFVAINAEGHLTSPATSLADELRNPAPKRDCAVPRRKNETVPSRLPKNRENSSPTTRKDTDNTQSTLDYDHDGIKTL